jgi:8-oxo-dGTP pyrophosphatase MutT (NUDIX family)
VASYGRSPAVGDHRCVVAILPAGRLSGWIRQQLSPSAGPTRFDEQAPVHVIISAVIVSRRGIVLHRHRILGTSVAPGGHVDPGERPADAVIREATEETGLVVAHPASGPTVIHVDSTTDRTATLHLDLRYLLDGGEDDPSPPPDESQEVAWFGWDEALSITEPCMRGIVRVLLADRP